MFKIDEALQINNNLWAINEKSGKLEFKYKDEILESYNNLFQTIFEDINIDPSTPQGQIITSLTQTDLASISFLENLSNAFFLGGNGYFLDLWSWNLFRVTRKNGIPSSVLIEIQGTPDTTITSDFLITDGNYNYQISKESKIGDDGKVEVLFYCTEINEFVAQANTINQIITLIDGVEKVNNNSIATGATLTETDGKLFDRCVRFGSTAKNASFRSILANIAQINGVIKVTGAENVGNDEAQINGLTIDGHSIALVIEGGKDEEIANVILESRSTGCGMMGDVSIDMLYNGTTYNFKFYRPTQIILKAEVTIKEMKEPPSNYGDVLKSNITNFINNLDIGTLITQPAISENLYKNLTGFFIKDVKFGLKTGDVGYTPIQLKLNEMAVISKDDIKVNLE
ncbi:TPA: baseplate J/gp47 family protein [Campylobacter jejuni]|nr:baseplate J/gp47 family protein [Campylobacter jejuni]